MSDAPASAAPAAWTQLTFESGREQAQALAERLDAAGALAVTLSDAGDEPLFEPGPGEAPLWDRTHVSALLPAGSGERAFLAALGEALAPAPLPPCRAERLAERDWVRTSVEDFAPVRFGRRLWIAPTWCEAPAAEALVRLDPGLAFGTGTHPTTALCLEWLDGALHPGQTLIDYGCGSGILALAGLALGAARAVAVDNDPQALLATRDNARLNGCVDRLTVQAPQASVAGAADLLVANILANPLVALAPRLAALVRAGGRLALSGVLAGQADEVSRAYRPWFDLEPPLARGDWVLIAGTRGG